MLFILLFGCNFSPTKLQKIYFSCSFCIRSSVLPNWSYYFWRKLVLLIFFYPNAMSNRFFIDNFCNKTVPPVGCLSQVYTEKLMICSCQWIECCLDISLSLFISCRLSEVGNGGLWSGCCGGGQRACLLIWRSEFESRWSLHFLFCKLFEENENKGKTQKEVGMGHL